MKPSTFPPSAVPGTITAIALPTANGIPGGSLIGSGDSGWAGLLSSAGSHSAHWAISFARSVTNSENMHQVGGFGDPPKVSRRETNTVFPFTDTV